MQYFAFFGDELIKIMNGKQGKESPPATEMVTKRCEQNLNKNLASTYRRNRATETVCLFDEEKWRNRRRRLVLSPPPAIEEIGAMGREIESRRGYIYVGW
jgi:hypothetical protein